MFKETEGKYCFLPSAILLSLAAFTVTWPSFSWQSGNSLQEAPPVEAVYTVSSALLGKSCCAGGSSQHPRGWVTHPFPAPRLGTGCCGFWVQHMLLAPVTYWLQIVISLTTAGKGQKGTEHKTFVSWLRTEKKLHPYTTSEKLCLFPSLSSSSLPALDSIMVNTSIF